MGRWDHMNWVNSPPVPPEDDTTYSLAGEFLHGLDVADWGCGTGWFSKYVTGRYTGIDESKTPCVTHIVDLIQYRSRTPGLMLRHVLEHNHAWRKILHNAIESFYNRMVLVLFTPFSTDKTITLGGTELIPDLSLPRKELYKALFGLDWNSRENLLTQTQYGIEHIFFIEKKT